MSIIPQNDNDRGQAVEVAAAECIQQLDFNPEYPANNTQPARLLTALLGGHNINPLIGWRSLGIYRLSDTVFQLRGMGWPVITGRLNVKNQFGEECHVADYFLPAEVIAMAGKSGREFVESIRQTDTYRRAA